MAVAGFEAQLARFKDEAARGKPRLGWKVALNDPAIQSRLGLSGPLVGWLDAAAFAPSGATVAVGPEQQVNIEAEVMLTMARDVRADEGIDALRGAIASVAPAIELVDYTRSSRELEDMVTYSFFHFGTVYGTAIDSVPGDAELLVTGVSKNGERAAEAVPARVPKDLAEIVALVASTLEEAGEALLAGDRIICGTYIVPFPVEPGDTVTASYSGGLGEVTVSFAATE